MAGSPTHFTVNFTPLSLKRAVVVAAALVLSHKVMVELGAALATFYFRLDRAFKTTLVQFGFPLLAANQHIRLSLTWLTCEYMQVHAGRKRGWSCFRLCMCASGAISLVCLRTCCLS